MLSLKNRKTPVQNKKDDETWESIALHYFLVSVFVFCGYGLYFWILFQFSVFILYFFECVSCWGCLFPFWDLCFCFLVVFFCLGFPFVYVFLFSVCSLLFLLLLLLLSCGFFVSIGHPIYLKVLCIYIQPLESTSKLRWKFLHRYQIVQVRNNLL